MRDIKMNVAPIFSKYANMEVSMNKRVNTHFGYTLVDLSPTEDTQKILDEMQELAEQNNLTLRVFWPGTGGTADMQPNRVNASITPGVNGKYYISDHFSLG
jgi:hypothetical protein